MNKDEDEDDAPTYVLEETNQSLSKEEYDALVSGKDSKEEKESVVEETEQKDQREADSKPKDKIAEVGTNAKKRKAAKIIGGDQGGGTGEDEAARDNEKPATKTAKKPKKKAKAVKLTFGDENEG